MDLASDLGTPMVRNESDPPADHPAAAVRLAQGLTSADRGDEVLMAGLGVGYRDAFPLKVTPRATSLPPHKRRP